MNRFSSRPPARLYRVVAHAGPVVRAGDALDTVVLVGHAAILCRKPGGGFFAVAARSFIFAWKSSAGFGPIGTVTGGLALRGASICAIRQGRSVATSMGYSPLEGLTMGTRTGSIDGNAVLRFKPWEERAKKQQQIADELRAKFAAIPGAIGFFVLYAALAGVKVFEQLVEGAKDGMGVVFRVIPYVVAMLVAIGMFTQSGALRVLEVLVTKVLSLPLISSLGFPVEVLPLVIVRPLSGGASTAVLGNIAGTYGADSLITKIAATMNGSTETTLYVAAVYFGAVGVRRMRHGIPTGLQADAMAMIFSVIFCRWILS